MMSRRRNIFAVRAALAALGVAFAAASAAAQPVMARVHPWCLIYQEKNGTWGCTYDSFAQCNVDARAGNTGFCAANPGYREPERHVVMRKRSKK